MHIMFIKLKERVENLFSKIEGDEDTIMGLPIKKIKEYLKNNE
jgi:predicted house-cleaning NTP pyrophosphatase (Maf/HAM1 superfamily)